MTALIIVDVQNDFTRGALSLENGPSKADIGGVITRINDLLNNHHFNVIVYTQDYHPAGHCSFSEWPEHCVAETWGSEFDDRLETKPTNCDNYFVIQKGTSLTVDSYSAFIDNDRKEETELCAKLLQSNIQHVYVCGLALDYCVLHTALDSTKYGFKTTIIGDCTAAYEKECNDKIDILKQTGVQFIQTSQLSNKQTTRKV